MSGDRSSGPASVLLRATLLRYLEAHHVMTLATSQPWAAAVFYVNDDFTLYFLSSPRSRHAQHLASDSRVAATVHEDYGDWREVKGVQLEATVRPVVQSDIARVRGLYARKFPVIGERGAVVAPLVEALSRIQWYEVKPQGIYFIDNAAGFGHRDFIDLGGQGPV